VLVKQEVEVTLRDGKQFDMVAGSVVECHHSFVPTRPDCLAGADAGAAQQQEKCDPSALIHFRTPHG
jgi:hypothetical protein